MVPRPVILAALALLAAAAPAFGTSALTILVRGADVAAPVDFGAAFTAASGIDVKIRGWDGSLDTLRARAAAVGAGTDLVLIEAVGLASGCAEGLFVHADLTSLGGADRFDGNAGACGIPALIVPTGLAWQTGKVMGSPGWTDFFDVAKYPGQRGLKRGARGNVEIALLADGVEPAEVYPTLRTKDGLERAFRKLDQLRPYITWYDTGDDALAALRKGAVLMTSGAAPVFDGARTPSPALRDISYQPKGAIGETLAWAVPAASTAQELAWQAVAFASLPAVAAHLVVPPPDLSLVRGADAFAASPPTPVALVLDEAFWRDEGEAITARFAARLTH